MFDFGFSEILLVFVLALIVLGPEKLPRVASQVGRWIGRARGMARQFREQLEEEVNLEEARKTRTPAPPPSRLRRLLPQLSRRHRYPPTLLFSRKLNLNQRTRTATLMLTTLTD